jgi:hypothetical protein
MPGALEECVILGTASSPLDKTPEEDEVWMSWQEPTAESAVIGVAYPATDVNAST